MEWVHCHCLGSQFHYHWSPECLFISFKSQLSQAISNTQHYSSSIATLHQNPGKYFQKHFFPASQTKYKVWCPALQLLWWILVPLSTFFIIQKYVSCQLSLPWTLATHYRMLFKNIKIFLSHPQGKKTIKEQKIKAEYSQIFKKQFINSECYDYREMRNTTYRVTVPTRDSCYSLVCCWWIIILGCIHTH